MRDDLMTTPNVSETDIEYPETDGLPLAENTLQFQWIATIEGNLEGMYRDDPNVFVAGDLFWYPVQGRPDIRTAPDALVVFGRPKGHRRSYQQWREGGIAPQVVFEVLSPSNRPDEMAEKLAFYERHGVEEYYIYDPDDVRLAGWVRQGPQLQPVANPNGWVSPRLGIRFDMSGPELVIFRPDGQRFLTVIEMTEQREAAQRQAEAAQRQAENERQAREAAQQQAEKERAARAEAERRAAQLAERLRALGIIPDE
jgi:Uma2 family endonuclease